MPKVAIRWLALLIPVLIFFNPSYAQTETRYLVFSNGDQIGYLKAVEKSQSVKVDYYISDNGRGPKVKEEISLGNDGRPILWKIQGVSYAGGAVDENFVQENGEARWYGLAEEGEDKSVGDRIYVGAAASPWALGLYARYILSQPDNRVSALPQGGMRLTKRLSTKFQHEDREEDIHIYSLDGLYFSPSIIALDNEGNLFADLNGGLGGRHVLVREDFAGAFKQLKAMGLAIIDDIQKELNAKLAHKYDVPWRVTNVRIFDPIKQTLSPESTVSVYQNKIVRVEQGSINTVPANQKLIDGNGGVLLPGLVNMHAHESKWMGLQRLAAGGTMVRDMGNDNQVLLEIDALRSTGLQDGPRIVRTGYLEGKSLTKASTGITAGSLDEAMEALHWYADHGYPYLKVYNGINPRWVKPLVAEAKHLGMRVIGHVPAFTTADAMIKAGFAEITHINQLALQYVLKPGEDTRTPIRLTGMHRMDDLDLKSPAIRKTIKLMKQHDVGLDTTIAAMERLNIQRDKVTPVGDELHLDHMPLMFQRNRRRTFLHIPDSKTDQAHFRARDKLVEFIGLLHRKGIDLWPGTDDEVAYTIHRELQLYVEAGVTPEDTLSIATYRSIKELGLDHILGTIEVGKYADFILVPGNPLEDITLLRKVNMVVKDGIVYFPSEIYKALNVKPFSSPPDIIAPNR